MGCPSIAAIPACASRKTVLYILIEFIDLYLFIRLSSCPSFRSISGQWWHRTIITAAWPLNGKIPAALVTVKTESTNYPETPQRCQIKLKTQNSPRWIIFKYCIRPTRCFLFSISTKHWNRSLMVHPVFFLTCCPGGPRPCPILSPVPTPGLSSVISKTPSSTLWKSISPQQTVKVPQDAAEEGDGHPAGGRRVRPACSPALSRTCRSHVTAVQAGDTAQSKD